VVTACAETARVAGRARLALGSRSGAPSKASMTTGKRQPRSDTVSRRGGYSVARAPVAGTGGDGERAAERMRARALALAGASAVSVKNGGRCSTRSERGRGAARTSREVTPREKQSRVSSAVRAGQARRTAETVASVTLCGRASWRQAGKGGQLGHAFWCQIRSSQFSLPRQSSPTAPALFLLARDKYSVYSPRQVLLVCAHAIEQYP